MNSPLLPDDVTAEWLTSALTSAGILTQGRVTSCATELLVSDKGMTGPIARVHLSYDRDLVDAPHSLIAKFSALDPENRALIHGMGFYEREVCFYQQLASQSRLRTPHCYFSALDPTNGTALLLLEDLAAARNGNTIAGCSVAEVDLGVHTLAAFHAVWWQHPLLEQQPWCALRSLISVEQTPAIFQQAWEPFLARCGESVADNMLEIGAWLDQYLGRLCAYLYQEPPCTLIHNDYHADNLFFAGDDLDENLIVIDWQLVTRGRGALDVASFVAGHLEPSDRREHELQLLHSYHTLLIDNGVHDYTFEQCWDDYRLALLVPISRAITVVGIGAATEAQARGYCDTIVPRYCQAVHDLCVGDLLHTLFART